MDGYIQHVIKHRRVSSKRNSISSTFTLYVLICILGRSAVSAISNECLFIWIEHIFGGSRSNDAELIFNFANDTHNGYVRILQRCQMWINWNGSVDWYILIDVISSLLVFSGIRNTSGSGDHSFGWSFRFLGHSFEQRWGSSWFVVDEEDVKFKIDSDAPTWLRDIT